MLVICGADILKSQESSCTNLFIYRPSSFSNSAVKMKVFLNDTEISNLDNKSAFQVILNEGGTYNVSVILGMRTEMYRKRTKKDFFVECGTDVYIMLDARVLFAEELVKFEPKSSGVANFNSLAANKQGETIIFSGGGVATAAGGQAPATKTVQQEPVQMTPKQVETQVVTRTGGTEMPANRQPPLNTGSGKSYALIIGVNDYNDYRINDLDQPIADAQKLYDVLITHYTFERQNVKFLKNPTKEQITQTLDSYFEKLKDKDMLLIFYAGHGYWDEKFQQGYWLAADAEQNNRGTWLSNGTIRDYMRAIPTRHSLLITDACFGGGIFKSRSAFANSSTAINQLYKLPSRKAMTSGAMSEVPDKSVFIEYLVKRLQQNEDHYLSSEQLFASFKIAVINNSANGQVPQYGEVKETGDEGGDFIFIRK